MKKSLITLSLILSFVPLTFSQAPPLSQSYSFTATGSTASVDISTRGLNYYRIQWSNKGTTLPSACTIVLQTSNNSSTWATGISGTCTTNGTSAVTQITTNYIRLNLSAYTAAAGNSELIIDVIGYYDTISNITANITGGGDASAAKQDTGNASLASIDTKLTSPITVTDGAGPLNVIVDSGGVTATLSAETTKVIGTVNVAAAQTIAVTNAGTFAVQPAGSTAIGATYSGNPINIACKAVNAEQTAVTNGQEVNCITDLVGKHIIIPYANPENFVQGGTAAITDTTSTSVIVSAGGSLRNYITHCTVSNSHATVGTFVKILDGSVIIDEVYAAAAGGGASLTYPVPLKGTAATAINAQPVTTGANVIVFCNGYKGL